MNLLPVPWYFHLLAPGQFSRSSIGDKPIKVSLFYANFTAGNILCDW